MGSGFGDVVSIHVYNIHAGEVFLNFKFSTTSAAVILILVGSSLDYGRCHPDRHDPKFKITNYFLGLGTLLFSYGGHSAFPTIQHDMKRPSDFTKSAIMAFISSFKDS